MRRDVPRQRVEQATRSARAFPAGETHCLARVNLTAHEPFHFNGLNRHFKLFIRTKQMPSEGLLNRLQFYSRPTVLIWMKSDATA